MTDSSDVRPPAPTDARLFSWGCWLVLSIALFGYLMRFASDVPYWDDEQYLAILGGESPLSLSWLFSQHSDHRLPLPRFIVVAACTLAGGDLRAAVYVIAALLCGAAAILLRAYERIPGAPAYAGAVIPLATLHWGQSDNLLFTSQVQVALSSALVAVCLVIMTRRREPPSVRASVAYGVALLGLCFCGGNGLAAVPPLAVWLFIASLEARRLQAGRARALAAGCTAVVCGVLAVTLALSLNSAYPRTYAPGPVLRTGLQFVGQAVGPAGGFGWPGTPMGVGAPPVVSLAIAGLATVSVAAAARRAMRESDERLRALGVTVFLAGLFFVALAVGIGRSSMGETAGLANRYITFALPFVWGILFAVGRYLPPAPSRFVAAGLLAAMCALLTFNTQVGFRRGRERKERMSVIERDVRDRRPLAEIAAGSGRAMQPDAEVALRILESLERNRLGPFRNAPE